MSSKKVTLKKKIGDEVFDILPKTLAEQVSYGNTSVKEFLDDLDSTSGNAVDASKITQDSSHKFVTEDQITEFENKSTVEVVTELPETVSENDLYLVLQED